jgi:hypothetical protein
MYAEATTILPAGIGKQLTMQSLDFSRGNSCQPAVGLRSKSTVYGLNGVRLVFYVNSLYHSL